MNAQEVEDFMLWESEIRIERSWQETMRVGGWDDERNPDCG